MSRPVSVLQVSSTGARAGVSSVVSLLSRSLRDRGFDVRVVCLLDGPLIAELQAEGIPAELLATSGPFEPAAILRMRRHLAERRYDVVHTHGQRSMFVGNIAARLERAPAVVTTFHELAAVKSTTSRLWGVFALAEGLLARGCTDAMVATSEAVMEDALQVRRVPAAKICQIHNGLDVERFHTIEEGELLARFRERLGLEPRDLVIGTMGSLVPIKGHRHLIEALPRIRAELPNARVVIAGTGVLRTELERLARERDVADHVRFAGDVGEGPAFYNLLDVFALPSLSESCPIVVLEAAACRVPIVSSAVGAVPELLRNGEAGVLVPPGDLAALAQAIVGLLREPERGERLAAAAASHVREEFSPEAFAERHVELYHRLLAGRGPVLSGAL